jgi:hypothetical protein
LGGNFLKSPVQTLSPENATDKSPGNLISPLKSASHGSWFSKKKAG